MALESFAKMLRENSSNLYSWEIISAISGLKTQPFVTTKNLTQHDIAILRQQQQQMYQKQQQQQRLQKQQQIKLYQQQQLQQSQAQSQTTKQTSTAIVTTTNQIGNYIIFQSRFHAYCLISTVTKIIQQSICVSTLIARLLYITGYQNVICSQLLLTQLLISSFC